MIWHIWSIDLLISYNRMKDMSNKKKIITAAFGVIALRMAYPIFKNLYFLYFKPLYWNHLKFSKTLKQEIESARKVRDSKVEFFECEEVVEVAEENDPQNRVSVRLMKSLEKKIIAGQRTNDPFLPPFDSGIFIMTLSKTHNLLFNKYMLARNHLLIITRIFEAQTDPLTESDLFETYSVMQVHEAFAFFNSDQRAGASQKHKHLQIIPYSSFDSHYLDLIHNTLKTEDENALEIFNELKLKFLRFPIFKDFKYCLAKFKAFDPYAESADDYRKYLMKIYLRCRLHLNIENKAHSFNFLFGENWMLLVLRKKEKYSNEVSLNSLAMLGSFLSCNPEKFEKIKSSNPSEIFKDILVQKDDEGEYFVIKE